jgi:hypothetical protein
MPLRVHLRPNGAYLAFLLLGGAAAGLGVLQFGRADDQIMRLISLSMIGGGALVFLAFGYPVVASTLFRVPVLEVADEQIRLPIMGPALRQDEIVAIREIERMSGARRTPLLLVMVADPASIIARTRPWLRSEARKNLQRYGTPIVLSDLSLNRPLDEIAIAFKSRFTSTA